MRFRISDTKVQNTRITRIRDFALNENANFHYVLDLRGEAGALSEGIMEIEMREDFRAHKGMVAAARSDLIYQMIGSLKLSFPHFLR